MGWRRFAERAGRQAQVTFDLWKGAVPGLGSLRAEVGPCDHPEEAGQEEGAVVADRMLVSSSFCTENMPWKSWPMNSSAPEITPVSEPDSSPPGAVMAALRTACRRMLAADGGGSTTAVMSGSASMWPCRVRELSDVQADHALFSPAGVRPGFPAMRFR